MPASSRLSVSIIRRFVLQTGNRALQYGEKQILTLYAVYSPSRSAVNRVDNGDHRGRITHMGVGHMRLTKRWQWLQRKVSRKLWLIALLYTVAGFISVLLGIWLTPVIPPGMSDLVTADAVGRILNILASSMLAVATFSLATLVTAHGSVTVSTSPRATALVMDNEVSRHALSVFIGTFLFSLVGLVALNAGVYGERGHVVLFLTTVLIIMLIVIALIRWIEHLSELAKVTETVERVEDVTTRALVGRARFPGIGARPCESVQQRIPVGAGRVLANRVGYLEHIDMAALLQCSAEHGLEIFVLVEPGTLTNLQTPLACVAGGDCPETVLENIQAAFSLGRARTFDYDPRFGLIVLGEIASRALSPGVNDAGTAIDVIGRATRALSIWATTEAETDAEGEAPKAQVWFQTLAVHDLLDDVFTPIARDGAGNIAVQIRLQKAFAALSQLDHRALQQAARDHSQLAWERARDALPMDFERDALLPLVLSRRD